MTMRGLINALKSEKRKSAGDSLRISILQSPTVLSTPADRSRPAFRGGAGYLENLNIAIETAMIHRTIRMISQILKKARLPLPNSKLVITILAIILS
jgi:hypothetical protein